MNTIADFHKALKIVTRAVSERGPLPVLQCVLVSAGEHTMTLSATNLDFGFQTRFDWEGDETICLCIPGRALTDWVAALAATPGEIWLTPDWLNIRGGRASTRLKGIPADEFPHIPSPPEQYHVELPGGQWLTALRQVAFSAAADSQRPALNGVHLYARGMQLRIEASDGYRLAVRLVSLPDSVAELDVILPANSVRALLAVLPGIEEVVRLHASEERVMMACNSFFFWSQTVSARFPNTDGVMPRGTPKQSFTGDAMAILAALKRADLFAVDHKVSLHAENGVMSVEGESAAGKTHTTLPYGQTTSFSINLSAVFLRQAIEALDGVFTLDFHGSERPVLLYAPEPRPPVLRMVIMPITRKNEAEVHRVATAAVAVENVAVEGASSAAPIDGQNKP